MRPGLRRAILPALALLLPAPAVAAEAVPIRVAVLDFAVEGAASAGLGRALGEVAATQAARLPGVRVVSQADLAAQLDDARRRQLQGCPADDRCMADFASALDVDRLLAGSAAIAARSVLLSVKAIDVRHFRTLARTGDLLRAPTQEEVLDAARRLAHEALTGQRLDTTGALQIEVSEPGAVVELDGREVGRTPLEGGRRVIEGMHRLVVRKEGFIPWEGRIAISAGTAVPIHVALVPLAAVERARRMYLDFFAASIAPRFVATNLDNCRGGCGGWTIGVFGGQRITPAIGAELFLFPMLTTWRASTRTVSAPIGGTRVVSTDYTDRIGVGGTLGGVAASARHEGTWPVTLRAFAGAARASWYADSGGDFPDAPQGHPSGASHPRASGAFWSPTAGASLHVGRRLSKGFAIEIGLSAFILVLPATRSGPEPSPKDRATWLPAGPALEGGVAWFYPADFALRFDFE